MATHTEVAGTPENSRQEDDEVIYMAKIKLTDRISSVKVAGRCGLHELEDRVRHRRLRWFGHVERAADTIIGQALVLPVDGRRPPGRPKKTWLDCVNEDLEALGIKEDTTLDREKWRRVIAASNPSRGKK